MWKAAILSFVLMGCASTPPKYPVGSDRVLTRSNGVKESVTIVGHGWRWIKGGNTLKVYEVRLSNGEHLAAQEYQLK